MFLGGGEVGRVAKWQAVTGRTCPAASSGEDLNTLKKKYLRNLRVVIPEKVTPKDPDC